MARDALSLSLDAQPHPRQLHLEILDPDARKAKRPPKTKVANDFGLKKGSSIISLNINNSRLTLAFINVNKIVFSTTLAAGLMIDENY